MTTSSPDVPEDPSSASPDAHAQAGAAHPRRAVRSFVVRAGRMTTAQERAWRDIWPRLGVETSGDHIPLDFEALFGRRAPLVVEVGFGNGESLVTLARAHPDRNYVGLEVHRPGVGHLLLRCEAERVGNVRVLCDDAVEVLQHRVADSSIDELLLYFPDPWPKKRHHKRRIVQPAFVDLVAAKLKPGGLFRMTTDWEPYAEHMLTTAAACATLRNESTRGDYVERPESRPLTKFEQRGRRLGHGVWDLAFRKK